MCNESRSPCSNASGERKYLCQFLPPGVEEGEEMKEEKKRKKKEKKKKPEEYSMDPVQKQLQDHAVRQRQSCDRQGISRKRILNQRDVSGSDLECRLCPPPWKDSGRLEDA